MSVETLSKEVRAVRPVLEEAVASHPSYTETPVLSQTCCGLATALLHNHLRRQGIKTERLIGDSPLLPRGPNSRRREHVVLRTDDGRVIDPSYSQFMNLMGYSAHLPDRYSRLPECLPTVEIAIFDQAKHVEFGRQFANHALAQRAFLLDVLPPEHASNKVYSPLLNADSKTVYEVYQDIWNMDHYEPFPVSDDFTANSLNQRADVIMKEAKQKTPLLGAF